MAMKTLKIKYYAEDLVMRLELKANSICRSRINITVIGKINISFPIVILRLFLYAAWFLKLMQKQNASNEIFTNKWWCNRILVFNFTIFTWKNNFKKYIKY